jgi:hypothetical protein
VSAEAIASVVADLRAGRIQHPPAIVGTSIAGGAGKVAANPGPVVDATAIYRSLVAKDEPIYLYEDHACISPPWPAASVCYVNEHGNVIVMTFTAGDPPGPGRRWNPGQPTDWDRVRWSMNAFVWVGGRGGNGASPTRGPVHLWQFAIYDDGEPADLHWVHLVPGYPMEHWDMAQLVLLGALNFLNCSNVDIVEPARPRAERRRIERTGVRVHTINVFPVGKATRGTRSAGEGSVPLHSVRGHFAKYGPQYDRGLLFGKYAGRFFRPQHARGAAEHGEVDQEFVLHPTGVP